MKIGLYIKWNKGSLNAPGNVLGDELIGESMCRALLASGQADSAELFAPNNPPRDKQDFMLYLNDEPPHQDWADKHVLYMQNAYGEGSDKALDAFHRLKYHGYAFISNRLLELHQSMGHKGIFLPFGVDTKEFCPQEIDPEYAFDVSYVGNDIKGEERTVKYLYPAIKFNFGLYGNWLKPKREGFFRKLGLLKSAFPKYQHVFHKISRGKIPQEKVPVLYASSKINLNCTAQDCVDWDVITLRTFEVLACRGFLITDKTPAAEAEMKGCAVFTDGGDDLKDKINYYLTHEEERLAIIEKGYQYATKHASIESRMKKLMAYLQEL